MTVSVVELVDGFSGTWTTTADVTIATTPSAGDVLVVEVFVANHACTVSGVSGCGATWTQAISSTGTSQPGLIAWVGTGATSAGTVTLTMSNSRAGLIRAYVVRGLSSGAITFADVAYNNSAITTPPVTATRSAGADQIVIVMGNLAIGTISTFPASPAPATGWDTATGVGTLKATDHRIPSTTEDHHVSIVPSTNNGARVVQLVLGAVSSVVAGDVALTATSTLTTTAIDTVLPTVALAATSTLTTAVSGVLLAGAAALVASSTLIPTMAPATVVSLSAVSSLTVDAATPVTAVVALSATSTLTTAGTVVATGAVTLGTVMVAAGLAVALAMAQPGTLANPYAASDSDTRSLDFASALFVATEPMALTGPPAAPSVWYEFTESQVADWLASTSSFAHGAFIELYSGPPGAGPDDLTFIATDGNSPLILGAVTLSALATIVATSLRVELVDLGAVTVAASPAIAVVLS